MDQGPWTLRWKHHYHCRGLSLTFRRISLLKGQPPTAIRLNSIFYRVEHLLEGLGMR